VSFDLVTITNKARPTLRAALQKYAINKKVTRGMVDISAFTSGEGSFTASFIIT
jgi:hypothetical protein